MNDAVQYEQNEIDKFDNLAHEWWDVNGQFKTLHHINPTRLLFITKEIDLRDKSVIDIGCGGGILTESIAKLGASVTGIDLAPRSIQIAKLHLHESRLNINYECTDIETLANSASNHYNILTCMEMLEHVPEPELIIKNCAKLLSPGGVAFFSTINRNLKSYLLDIIAAEYILKIIPQGTHEYKKFIKPSELCQMLIRNGFTISKIAGISYNPLTHISDLKPNVDTNYILSCRKI